LARADEEDTLAWSARPYQPSCNNAMIFPQLLELYRHTLLDDVLPFWDQHGFDPSGGINTCINDDGTPINRDRWNWSQWRAVWVWSKLYNALDQRKDWLDRALGVYRFVTAHGPLADGHWPLLLDGDGKVLRGYESFYVDGFALLGLAELYRATSDARVREHALRTVAAARAALESPAPPPLFPYSLAEGHITHGVSMLFSLALHETADAIGDAEAEQLAIEHHRRVMDTFARSDRNLVLEYLSRDGRELPPPKGTVVVPGHAIESMWFQMHIARSRGDAADCHRAADLIRRHLELGWDTEFGGLFLAVDADGRDEVAWDHAQTKLWWPHTEALYATLLAYEITRESWCLEWHDRVREYCYAHYPVPVHGEWRQKLDRQGNPITAALVLPVKDPFHLPRTLIYCIEVLERLAQK
jgi:N-acylglucosamine 2-epimerase